MTLWATGRYVRVTQHLRCSGRNHDYGVAIRSFSTTSHLVIDVVKGANRPAGRSRRKKHLAKLKDANERDDWDDGDIGTLEESVGGPSAHAEEDGPRITKIGMKKPRPRPQLKFAQVTAPREGQEEQDTESVAEDLPLPPFMREKKKSTRFDKWYKNGTYAFDPFEPQKAKENKAPFATAFAQNPWAQMLATPMRLDSYTGARLPKACLLDFHLADDVDNEKTKLLPLSLAAAMLNKKRRWSQEERQLRDEAKKENAVKPEGAATYVILKKEAMEDVGQDPKTWRRKRVLSSRIQQAVDRDQLGAKLEWRQDMAQVVLISLRKIVRQRLRDMIVLKAKPTQEGVVAALPNKYGLYALDDVENVGCVVRLQPRDPDEPAGPKRIPEPKDPMRSHFWPNSTSFLGDTYGDWDLESPAKVWARDQAEREARGEAAAEVVEEQSQGSTTQILVLDHWSKDDKQGSPFLGHCLPLPPPNVPTSWYYPTIRYRSQRVPIYDLPHLLGDEEMKRLLQGTAFDDTKVVAICQPWVSAELQAWLFKLQMFVASTKEETRRV
ncbi:MAG: hypothetical protein Q9159_000879 [Coniocarpon cinnabarinum]